MKSEFEIAITQLCADRNVSPEVILEAIEASLVSAYKRNYGADQNVSVTLDRRTGQAKVVVKKAVVSAVEDEDNQIGLPEARRYDAAAEVGAFVDIELKPRNFGRIAAQTAKQVIMQRIREAERDSVYVEYADRVGELANGVVRNVDSRSRSVTVNLGRAEAILPRSEQIPGEYYRFNQRLRVYISQVERSTQGPQIVVSRAHPELLRRLLELEVPEIHSGTVEVKAIAREAGSRSKVAVAALQRGVDPVGSCVGMRGVRIQNIVNELNGEKIDVVPWSREMDEFIGNSLSPARVVSVYLFPDENTAKVVVPDTALSLAIGKEGQNARLAHKLTGWRIDISSEAEAAEEAEELAEKARQAAERAKEQEEAREAAAALLAEAEALIEAEDSEQEAEASESDAEAAVVEPEAEVAEDATAVDEPDLTAVESVTEAEPASEATETDDDASVDDESETVVSSDEVDEETADEAETLPGASSAAETVETAETDQPDVDDETGADVVLDEQTDTPDQGVTEPEATEEVGDVSREDEKVVEDWSDDDDDDETDRSRKSRRRRDRVLEYDERLGRVVARKRRKRDEKWRWDDDEY